KYDCGSCHQLTSPTGYFAFDKLNSELVNIGLDAVYNDKGFGAVSGNTADNGKFKIPNLRNIALTAPYMHDGRFKTLEEVLDHYSTGIENNPNLDSRLKDAAGKPVVLNITSSDKQDLIAFLQTLTDNELVTDPRFSDPFKKN
ncbi:MAG: cytochrome-c peroxidase, partial [Owenweeksia sp.]